MTLTEFLLARIAEDHADATRPGNHWTQCPLPNGGECSCTGPLFVRNARALAECEAKRRIVEDHAPTSSTYFMEAGTGTAYDRPSVPACRQCTRARESLRVTSSWDAGDRVVAPCDTLRILALPYADHLDYQQEWAL